MALLIVLAVVLFVVGAGAAARWLPALPSEGIGSAVFSVVCGLLGAAAAVVAVQAVETAKELQHPGPLVLRSLGGEVHILANGLFSILDTAGTLVALAFIVYLLALRALGSSRAAELR